MASFFGEVVTPSYRYIDDESPDYIGTDCGVWEAGAGLQLEKSLLVITEGEIAGSYAQLWGGVEEVGRLECRPGQATLPVEAGAGYSLVRCPPGLAAGEQDSLARALLSLAAAACPVLVLTARHTSQLADSNGVAGATLHSLTSKAWPGPLVCPALPQPALLAGLPSALLTCAQVSDVSLCTFVCYTDVLTVDSLTVAPFLVINQLDCVARAGINKIVDIGAQLCKQKLATCDNSVYM